VQSSSPSPSQGSGGGGGCGAGAGSGSKTLVILRKKSSKDNVLLRNCKTLPRGGGPLPSNCRFSIDSDVYGLYGNLINVRGLSEDEGRFVDPLYDALRRSDPELNALDAKLSTLDRRLKMRMSRPRSLDLSNWSVDSKISASSDESGGGGGSGSLRTSSISSSRVGSGGGHLNSAGNTPPPPPTLSEETDTVVNHENKANNATTSRKNNSNGTSKHSGNKNKSKGPPSTERTILVVVGGRGYLNMKAMAQEHFISTTDSETKSSPHLTLWQMKT
jgi:Rho guanine nucleotide exchange factor 10